MDEEWPLMEPHCLGRPYDGDGDGRRFVEVVLWIAQVGAAWHKFLADFGHWNTVFKWFRYWAKRDVFKQMCAVTSADLNMDYA